MLEKLVQKLLPLIAVSSLYADTSMTVSGPVFTTGDYISNGTGVLEKKWRYEITNTSTDGDVNNMIEFHINAGNNKNILNAYIQYGGDPGTITPYRSASTSGFTGLLPPTFPLDLAESQVNFFIITPADTQSAPGLATATAEGIGYNVPFNSVAVQVPADLPTQVKLESATKQIGGQTEIRYKITNLGTAIINSVDIPVGTNNLITEYYVPGGVTVTVNEINSHIVKDGGINLRESVIYKIKSSQKITNPANAQPINARISVGSEEIYQGVPVPGETL
ncbi:MAG: hypothetical protein NTV46_03205, partial [Verrucomicrobia bacterium]|nr:hypothetical protein [Verrucomicrobiota bacterium]